MSCTTTAKTCPLNTPGCTGTAAAYGNGIADVWVTVPCGCDDPERLARLALERLLDEKGPLACPSVSRNWAQAYLTLGGRFAFFTDHQVNRWPFLVRYGLVEQKRANVWDLKAAN